jgi:GMP synthase (glutamine-hydrolysing)
MSIVVLDNEVKPDYRYLAPEIVRLLPDSTYRSFVDDPTPPPFDDVAGVVITGSTWSVYEEPRPRWVRREADVIDRCIETGVPLLGICFGHQIINDVLGGVVREDRRRATFVEMVEYERGPSSVLDGVDPIVPVLHGDLVEETGEGMRSVARSTYDGNFCTRHESAPVWTVQFHPEFTERVADRPRDWSAGAHSFTDSNATRVLDNFAEFCGYGDAT